MQEEITQGAVSLSVETGKMTADLLQKALKEVLEEMQKKPSQRSLHQGKQALHQLKQHGASLTNIEITEQNIKAFSAVAKKYDIDYALKKDPKTLPISKRKQEYADLKEQRDTDYTKLKAARAEVAELQKIRKCVDIALKAEQPEQTQNRTKRHEQER